jgi:hypothetical protein
MGTNIKISTTVLLVVVMLLIIAHVSFARTGLYNVRFGNASYDYDYKVTNPDEAYANYSEHDKYHYSGSGDEYYSIGQNIAAHYNVNGTEWDDAASFIQYVAGHIQDEDENGVEDEETGTSSSSYTILCPSTCKQPPDVVHVTIDVEGERQAVEDGVWDGMKLQINGHLPISSGGGWTDYDRFQF